VKNLSINIALTFLFVLINGCNLELHNFEQHENELFDFLATKRDLSKLENISEIIIIPSVGCSGCITEAENKLKNHILSGKVDKLFILTEIRSMKITKAKLTYQVLNSQNIILDNNSILGNSSVFSSIYPTTITLEKGKIINVVSKLNL
jgi:hypothetical protein